MHFLSRGGSVTCAREACAEIPLRSMCLTLSANEAEGLIAWACFGPALLRCRRARISPAIDVGLQPGV